MYWLTWKSCQKSNSLLGERNSWRPQTPARMNTEILKHFVQGCVMGRLACSMVERKWWGSLLSHTSMLKHNRFPHFLLRLKPVVNHSFPGPSSYTDQYSLLNLKLYKFTGKWVPAGFSVEIVNDVLVPVALPFLYQSQADTNGHLPSCLK